MSSSDPSGKLRIAFLYLGKSGSVEFALEMAEAAAAMPDLDSHFIVSAEGDLAPLLGRRKLPHTTIATFKRATPQALVLGYRSAREDLLEWLEHHRPDVVMTLMPHVWSPLLKRDIQKLGIAYFTIIHDADSHPGDPTARLTKWLMRDARGADAVVTLSRAVASRLVLNRRIENSRILPLFLPDLNYQLTAPSPRTLQPGQPFRILFFGRVMAYKGLGLLIDAVEQLRGEGLAIELGLAGSGDLGSNRKRLEALGGEIENRWIADDEVSRILSRFDCVACSHVEASQSGVASTAFGHGLPVVAMPVGGMAEQVIEGQTGTLARRISAAAYADAIRRLMSDPGLYAEISRNICQTAPQRSFVRFLEEIADEVTELSVSKNG